MQPSVGERLVGIEVQLTGLHTKLDTFIERNNQINDAQFTKINAVDKRLEGLAGRFEIVEEKVLKGNGSGNGSGNGNTKRGITIDLKLAGIGSAIATVASGLFYAIWRLFLD